MRLASLESLMSFMRWPLAGALILFCRGLDFRSGSDSDSDSAELKLESDLLLECSPRFLLVTQAAALSFLFLGAGGKVFHLRPFFGSVNLDTNRRFLD